MPKLLDTIRTAIKTSGRTRYLIAKETGIAASQLSRLLNGEAGLSVETIETLVEYLGLEIVVRPKRGKRR